jgi:hypothetical protein
MTGDAYTDRLLDLAYGELSGREARDVEAHATTCAACRAELARIRETRRIMSALPQEPAPDRGEGILLAAARQASGGRRPRRVLPPWVLGAAVAACSIVAVAAVSYRIVALRPGPLQRQDAEALLGESRHARPSAPAEVAPAAADRAAEKGERAPEAGALAPAPEEGRRPVAGAGRAKSREAEVARAEAPEEARREPALAERHAAPAARTFAAPPPAPSAPAVAPLGPQAEGAAARAAPSAAARDAAPGAEVRTFPGCEGERVRWVERDPRGRIARYVREGSVGGRRLRIEHLFSPDGALATVAVRDLDAPDAALDAAALGLSLPASAAEAAPDAPPRCGR